MSEDVTRRPFASWLQDQRGGGLHGELTDELADLVTAVREHDKPGTLTLTITVKPNADSFFVSDEVKVKAPRAERGSSLFFADDTGNLMRRDPRQPELPLREVPDRAEPAREVAS
jgi:hypothetical protein